MLFRSIATLIRVHRVRGHLIADLDPLRWHEPEMPPELDPATYGLTIWDLDREFLTGGVGGVPKSTLGKILGHLRDAYCRTIGIEYMHIHSTEEQRWVQERVEGHGVGDYTVNKRRILERLNAAEAFERFLAFAEAKHHFSGKIIDIDRRTTQGFARGTVILEHVTDPDRRMRIEIQNEYLVAFEGDRPVITVPDLISMLDHETATPITTETLAYGQRVDVIAMPCAPEWHQPGMLELVEIGRAHV